MADHSPPPRTQSVRLTLAGLLVIPMVSLTALWGFVAIVTFGNVVRDQHYNAVTSATGSAITVLTADLLAERTTTLDWLGSGRQSGSLRNQLEEERRSTDKYVPLVRNAFESVLGLVSPAGKADYEQYFAQLASLTGIRAAVDSGADSQTAAFDAYSTILAHEYAPFLVAVSTSDANINLMSQFAIAETRATDSSAGALALIQGALAAHGMMRQPERELFAEVVGQQNLEVAETYSLATNPVMTAIYNRDYATPAFRQLQGIENQVEASPANRPIPVKSASLPPLIQKIQASIQAGGLEFGAVLSAASAQLSDSLQTELYVAGGLGLVALVVSVFVMVRFGRRLRVELTGLYDSARQMAEERLPRLVERLRHGDDVDVQAESPPLRTGHITEIADVAGAFTTVQRTAVEAAVGQAALRKGVNQVFVSLSLRNQSLLHRQLGMLDDMERATSDPVALADLFRLDHLTTRMRRHAEGLLILAGTTPGRGWRAPVPVADVLNAAVAEVEDYVRVDVVTESTDALAGTAVNDVIHLLAELVENATQFSPPNTRVQVSGESVARGFAVEVEDRGLGMDPQTIVAINGRLASPPEFDLATTDQLGLFVAARLAQRHGIRVALRQSPFGGTTAVVLLPREIIAPENQAGSWTGPDSAAEPTTAAANGFARDTGAADNWEAGAAFGMTGRHRGGQSRSPDLPAEDTTSRFPALPPAQRRPGSPVTDPAASWRTTEPDVAPGPAAGASGSDWFHVPGRSSGFGTSVGVTGLAGSTGPGSGEAATGTVAAGTHMGMPRRVRLANLAPQLRRKDGSGPATPEREAASGPVRPPEQTSTMLSALQAGWLRGRLDDLEYPTGPNDREV